MTINSNDSLASMTGARQTMMSWARVIENRAAIPDMFREACATILADGSPFPYTVLAPPIHGARQRATEKLLSLVDRVLYVWELAAGQIVLSAYPLDAICSLEVGSILLNSWLKISGKTLAGEPSATVIPFNTATLRHLAPFIDKIRPETIHTQQPAWQAELAKLDALAAASFKFMNFARESMVPGTRIIQTIWQPPIRQAVFSLFGHALYRTRVLAHLALLTDQEVILIRDDEHSTENRGVRYGGVWQYIPLRHITALTLSQPIAEQLTLSFSLSGSEKPVYVVFSATSQPALALFRDSVQATIGYTQTSSCV